VSEMLRRFRERGGAVGEIEMPDDRLAAVFILMARSLSVAR